MDGRGGPEKAVLVIKAAAVALQPKNVTDVAVFVADCRGRTMGPSDSE